MCSAALTGPKIITTSPWSTWSGKLLARRRISDDAAGLASLLELLAGHGDDAGNLIPVAIETPRGLLTACLRAACC